MNKRQWKKRYKKLHGCNPPTVKQVKNWIDVLQNAIGRLQDIFCKFPELIAKATDNIKTMPEEEFNEKLQLLTPEQQELALKIRYKRKGQIRNEDMSEMW